MERAIEAEGKKNSDQQPSVPLKVDGINGKWGFARVKPVTEKPIVLENSETFRYMTAVIDKSPCRCCNKPLDDELIRYFVPDRIIVKTNQKPEEFHGYAKDKFGLDFLYDPPLQTNTSVFEMSVLESVTGKDLFATIGELNQNSQVEFAEPYEVVFDSSLYEPGDTHYTDRSQWGVRSANDGPSMKVFEAWNVDNNKQYQQSGITKQNAENWGNLGDPNPASTPNVIIAMIDSGVQTDHNDFIASTLGDTDVFITGGDQNFSGSGGPTDVSDDDIVRIEYTDAYPADYLARKEQGLDPAKSFTFELKVTTPKKGMDAVTITPSIRNGNGMIIEDSYLLDGPVMVSINLANNNDSIQPYAAIVEVRNAQDITVYLQYRTGALDPKGNADAVFSWKPDEPSRYTIRTLAISSLSDAEILSPIKTMSLLAR